MSDSVSLAKLVAREVAMMAEAPICTVLTSGPGIEPGQCSVHIPGAWTILALGPLEKMSLEEYKTRELAPVAACLKNIFQPDGYVPNFGSPDELTIGREGFTAILDRAAA